MKLFWGEKNLDILHEKSLAVTIGNFDGVHLGHQALINELNIIANRHHLLPLVVLFEPQPAEFLNRKNAPARLSSLREKIQYLKALDVPFVLCLKFDGRLARMSASDFAHHTIFKMLKSKYLLLGEDFRFGYKREGDFNLLKKIANQYNCQISSFLIFMLTSNALVPLPFVICYKKINYVQQQHF